MDFAEVMSQLEAAGSEQTRKTYARHGVSNEMFGVSYATMGILKKKIKTDHTLAKELWATGNHDARILATMIADPAQMTAKDLDSWAKDLANYVATDAFARMAAQSAMAQKRAEKWRYAKDEWLACVGWTMLAQSVNDQTIPDAYFEPYLEIIERTIHSRPNRVRH